MACDCQKTFKRYRKQMTGFKPIDISIAQEFLVRHHWGVLATRRKDGGLQMSPITVGLDDERRAIISSRETAYKVNNLRRDPRAALCTFSSNFHGGGWVQVNGRAEILSLPDALATLVTLQRQVYGEHKSGWVSRRMALEAEDHRIGISVIEIAWVKFENGCDETRAEKRTANWRGFLAVLIGVLLA
jgi:PPOX class probable F420-dependent enzyme